MANVDIAAETLKVGNAMASVRIDQMILNLAKGIAWGQYDLDKVGVDITKMMGVPGTVSIGDEKLSMLDAGFLPSFYHFVDTILEIKMDVHIREEESSSQTIKASQKGSTTTETGAEAGMKASGGVGLGPFSANVEVSAKAHWSNKTTAAYSRSLDATHAQKFSQDLAASSLMRTKIVPVPPPDLLVERIKILLDRLRKEAEDEETAQILFTLSGDFAAKLNDPGTGSNKADIVAAFRSSAKEIALKSDITVTQITEGSRWTLNGKLDDDTAASVSYFIEKSADQLRVYQGSQANKKSLDQILMDKVSQKLLEIG